jgi:DNA-binding response OmpR family regulator
VDDDSQFLEILTILLRRSGFEVARAPDGLEALQMLEKEAFDLVISDIDMPGANGFELCQRLRADARWREAPVILMSGSIEEDQEQRAMQAGATAFIKKPFSAQILLAKVKACLG